MDIITFFISAGSMGLLGTLFSVGLSIANKKFHVDEDPRITAISEELPGANCGACGFAGCANFAENLAQGNLEITTCGVASAEDVEKIAEILGIEATATEQKMARIMCQGGFQETAKKAGYIGIQSCLATHLMSGGEKLCEYGCLGFGDCIETCPFDAIYLTSNSLPSIIESKCTGCGKCIEVCPRDVIELHPLSHRLFVLCKNHDNPKYSRKICTRACIGCQICVRAVSEKQMLMEKNLARINYEIYGRENILPTDRCPTECLVIINNKTSETTEEVPS